MKKKYFLRLFLIGPCVYIVYFVSGCFSHKPLQKNASIYHHSVNKKPLLKIFVTFNDKNKYQIIENSASLAGLKVDFFPIPQGVSAFTYYDKLRNFTRLLRDHDIVMHVDSFDQIALASTDEVREKVINIMMSEGKEMIFSTEMNCYPPFAKGGYDGLEQGRTSFQFSNGGAAVGTVRAWTHFLSWKTDEEIKSLMVHELGSNQGFMHNYLFEHPHLVARDSEQVIWQSMYHVSWKEISIERGRVFNKVLNTFPCFLHFNGNSHLTIDWKIIMADVLAKITKSKKEGVEYSELSDEVQRDDSWPQLRQVIN
jgi:hypothetical protein